jgi:chaperonin cofactor prefoldin
MRDLGVLKERIEFAERHLQAAHSARERESEALMAMWRQIRDRFEAQEAEIERYRSELTEMTRVNDELSQLVDRLIASVEGSVQASASETVPEVAHMAHDLLKSEPPRRSAASRQASAAPRAEATAPGRPTAPARPARSAIEDALAALETDDPLDLGTPIEEPEGEKTRSSFTRLLNEQLSSADDDNGDDAATAAEDDDEGDTVSLEDEDDGFDMPEPQPVARESGSPGIRDLISRIEGAVSGGSRRKVRSAGKRDEDLARELQEIETLRNELSGLRDKITAGR